MSQTTESNEVEFGLLDFSKIVDYARSRLLAIRTELEKTQDTLSPVTARLVGEYLNWEAEAFTMPWMAYCAGLSINPPLSRNLRHLIGVLAMKQLAMLTDYLHVYESFMTLSVQPSGPWTKGRPVNTYHHAWWTRLVNLKRDDKFFGTYPNHQQVQAWVTKHFEQLPEGMTLVTPATVVEPMSTLLAQQLSTIYAEAQEEGRCILKMMEDKVLEAKMVAATMVQMDTALGDNVITAIATTEKLMRYLKREDMD
ncbi:uncharacterized protein F5147DRAFT_654632 [Suillus discolor]|uniref:Uncharacterized protein n=1 Tax=Suillus discolor TaxID=1912936 RepID=A0A9P7F3Q0_9AGAM|nr:uncharacterized protein F5147DRAFT_654632 [Suillus discolor]KAG2103720.1 hypothetical protein F5147DRAFT_654632 [Suillus discolor]